VVVGSRVADGLREVDIQVRRASPRTVLSPTTGIVTGISAGAVGRPVRDGDALFAVDGITALASTSPVLLFRPLHVGDVGPDVAVLSSFLVGHRFSAGPDGRSDRFTTATSAAVRRLQVRIGARATGSFLPGYLAHVGPGFGSLASFSVEVGQPVSLGSPMAVSSPRIVSVQVKPTAGGPALDDVGTAPVRLSIAGSAVAVRALPLDSPDAQRVGRLLLARLQPSAAPSASELLFAGITLRLSSPRRYGSVPAAAVDITAGGRACVYVVTGSTDDTLRLRALDLPTPLRPSPEIGVAYVPPGLVGKRVIRDANAVAAQRRSKCA
jgi:hypothetical protein